MLSDFFIWLLNYPAWGSQSIMLFITIGEYQVFWMHYFEQLWTKQVYVKMYNDCHNILVKYCLWLYANPSYLITQCRIHICWTNTDQSRTHISSPASISSTLWSHIESKSQQVSHHVYWIICWLHFCIQWFKCLILYVHVSKNYNANTWIT